MTAANEQAYDSDELGSIDLPAEAQQGDGIPRVWWKYGTAPKEAGHFYTRAEDWTEEAPAAPWEPCELYAGEAGFKAEEVRVIFIVRRSQAYRKTKDASGGNRREYHPRWVPGVTDQVHTEWLCFFEGLAGPAVFSFHGMMGKRLEGKKDGLLPEATRLLAGLASGLYRRKIGLSVFWVPIGPALDRQGKPLFTRLEQGANLNLPELRLPRLDGKALVSACYVGRETVGEITIAKDLYAAWAQEMRDTNAQAQAPAAASAPAQAGRNTPQPYDPNEEYDGHEEVPEEAPAPPSNAQHPQVLTYQALGRKLRDTYGISTEVLKGEGLIFTVGQLAQMSPADFKTVTNKLNLMERQALAKFKAKKPAQAPPTDEAEDDIPF